MTDTRQRAPRPVVYRPESAVFWVFVVALIVGTFALLDDSGPVIRATLDAHLDLAWLWLLFIAFMVWLLFRKAQQRAALDLIQAAERTDVDEPRADSVANRSVGAS